MSEVTNHHGWLGSRPSTAKNENSIRCKDGVDCGESTPQPNSRSRAAAIFRVKWSKYDIAALAAVTLVYVFLIVLSPSGIWIIDEGNKYIWAHNLAETGTFTLTDRAEAISPGHGAFIAPFSTPAGEGSDRNSVFSPIFILLISPFVKLGGFKLALAVPMISSILLIAAVRQLSMSFGIEFKWYSMLILGLASPVLFYSITLWEHNLAILLGIYAIVLARSDNGELYKRFGAGFLLSAAVFIRPEMVYFAAGSWIFLMKDRVNALIGGAAGLIIMLWVNWLTAGTFLPLQVMSNFGIRWEGLGFLEWVISRGEAIYTLLLQSSHLWYLSLTVIAAAAGYIAFPGLVKFLFPVVMFISIIYGWFDSQPFYHAGSKVSMLFAAPLFFAALFIKPDSDDIKRIRNAVILTIFFTVMTTPVFHGIHFGPRLQLPVIPLLAILLSVYMSRIFREGNVFKTDALIGLIVVQLLVSVWSVDLLFDKRSMNKSREDQILAKSRNNIVTLKWWLQQEIPELYFKRDVYMADTLHDFRLMLIDFYRKGVRYFTVIVPEDTKSPLIDFVNSSPPKQIGVFKVETDYPNMNLTAVQYALGFDVAGAAKLADELGVYFGQIGKLDESERYLRYATSWDSEAGKYHYNLGYCLGKKGNTREALEEIERAHELDPEDELIARMTRELRAQMNVVEIEGEQ